jgi:hypothetical protein
MISLLMPAAATLSEWPDERAFAAARLSSRLTYVQWWRPFSG